LFVWSCHTVLSRALVFHCLRSLLDPLRQCGTCCANFTIGSSYSGIKSELSNAKMPVVEGRLI
jgi:hypothetical protein